MWLPLLLERNPGCVHWHFKQGKARGVLEVTWWPCHQETEPPRLWISVHGNRMADWVEPLMLRLKWVLESRLNESA